MVSTVFASRVPILIWHERTAWPFTCTVHAPHSPAPQPKRVPVSRNSSRRYHRSGMSGSSSYVWGLPLTVSRMLGNLSRISRDYPPHPAPSRFSRGSRGVRAGCRRKRTDQVVADYRSAPASVIQPDAPVLPRVGEVAVVIRIDLRQPGGPSLQEQRVIRGRMPAPAARAFMVVQLRVRRIDDGIPALANAQTQIDVVEHHAQLFVESSDLLEDPPRHQHACAGDRAAVPGQIRKSRNTEHLSRRPAERMRGHAGTVKHDAGMLDRPIGVEQL